jgi:hypothetical protein
MTYIVLVRRIAKNRLSHVLIGVIVQGVFKLQTSVHYYKEGYL